MEKKQFKFEIKELKEDGEFEGYAAVFGNTDKGGDVIDGGAFTKTLLEKQTFPLTWLHNVGDILGIVEGKEDGSGLRIKGQLNLAVQSAKEKYALLKQGAVRGLSIGYDAVKALFENNGAVRRLKEIKLYEVALVPFPMNELAQVMAIKHQCENCQYRKDAPTPDPEPPAGTPGDEGPQYITGDPVTDQLLEKLAEEVELFHKSLGGKTS